MVFKKPDADKTEVRKDKSSRIASDAETTLKFVPRQRHKQANSLHLSLSLIGSFQIGLNGQPVSGFDYDKMRALLVFLVDRV